MNFFRINKQAIKIKHKKLKFVQPILFGILLLSSCNSSESDHKTSKELSFYSGEYIYRTDQTHLINIPPPESFIRPPYPWEEGQSEHFSKITKEFFRCKGSSLNPVRTAQEKGELVRYVDCGGSEKHSLPLRDGKEFIYPILIELLNYIQTKTKHRVIVTSGHRCPEHNTYVDPSAVNRSSKHMIGAEVSFYVQGLEQQPETIVKLLQEYYKTNSKYKDKKEFLEFQRYEKTTDVSVQPWFNKEIFIKLFKPKEGRNFDNRHPYPYLSIQVRFDYDKSEKVVYSWDAAFKNYLRH